MHTVRTGQLFILLYAVYALGPEMRSLECTDRKQNEKEIKLNGRRCIDKAIHIATTSDGKPNRPPIGEQHFNKYSIGRA